MEILITNISLITFGGSEIDTLTVAQYFQTLGHNVIVACFKYGYPMKKCFEDAKVKVIALFDEELESKKYDLVWSHHADILNYCVFTEKIEATKIVHHILSPYEYLESLTPYYQDISYYVCNSEETKQKIISEGVDENQVTVLSNSAPQGHFDLYRRDKILLDQPRKIAIISNHLAPEIVDFSNKYQEIVDIIGIEGVQKEVNPTLLSEYDLIITIGKTIQFCFAQGIPVYCYDRFGGPGYITKDNIDVAHKYNFSGRGFDCFKSVCELEHEIFLQYKKHEADLPFLHDYAKEHLNYNKNMNDVMDIVEKTEADISLDDIRQKYAYLQRVNLAFVREYRKNYLMEIANQIAQGRIYFKKQGELQKNFIEVKQMIKDGIVKFVFDISHIDKKNLESIYFYPSYGHFVKSKILTIVAEPPVSWSYLNCVKITDEFDLYLCNDACYVLTANFEQISSLEISAKIEIMDNSQFTMLVDGLYHKMKVELDASKYSESKLKSDLKSQLFETKKLNKQLQDKLAELESLKSQVLELESIKNKNIIQSILKIEESIKRILK